MTSALRETGSTRRWRVIRHAVLRRDRHRCFYCGGEATTVDHRIRREQGGDDRWSNLVACCTDCQSERKRPKSGAFFQRARTSDTPLLSNLHTPSGGRLGPVLVRGIRRQSPPEAG